MGSKATFQTKSKVLNKLFENGYTTEKDLQSLTLEKALAINGITIPELTVITELQKYAKAGKLYSYLGGDIDNTAD